MDIEKLIETLRQHGVSCVRAYGRYCSICDDAATALSTLQDENEKLRADVVRLNDMLASYQNVLVPELRVENENLKERIEDTRLEWYAKGFGEVIAEVKRVRAELEQVKEHANAYYEECGQWEAENEKLRETVDKYATAARVIALHLKPFCDESLPYDEMIADAARKASDELEQVKRENNALWTYIEIVDREYRRYMDRGYIDRLDELRRTWKYGQKED